MEKKNITFVANFILELTALMILFSILACADKHSNCEQWASSGECQINPDWMLVNCQESCGLCCELKSNLPNFLVIVVGFAAVKFDFETSKRFLLCTKCACIHDVAAVAGI